MVRGGHRRLKVRSEALLHLCYEDLRGMALQLLADYYDTKELPFRPFDPLDFATNYMKLTVRYENLSYGRRVILGCIAYENTVLEIKPGDPTSYIPIAERTVFLDDSLKKDNQRGRRNFTLAHECSHQAIYLLNPEVYGRCQYRTPGGRYSLRELATENDWFEWQANALAAELLMPIHLVSKVMSDLGCSGKVPIYPDDKLLFPERRLLHKVADFLGVSKAALLIRFKQLNLLDYRSREEYLKEEEIDCLIGGY